jgi:MoaA/NifB/PqqE/SkfB family radical SAM enzyme
MLELPGIELLFLERLLNLTEESLICTRPFEWLEIHPDGSVFLCCPAWLKRPIGNLLQQNIEAIWNGPVAREIRKSVLNGSFHNCSRKRCPHLANSSLPVCQIEQISDPELKSVINDKSVQLPFRPRQLNLCFDRSCNLACPSCRGNLQQAQGTELAQVKKIAAIIDAELLADARCVTLSGFGDPFGSPAYLQVLRKLNRRAYPLLEQVRIHTNGQLLTEQMWQSLPGLQPLVTDIEVSIDAATESTYHQNRPAGSFRKLLQNLDFLKAAGIRLKLSMVVQENNWREIPQLLELAKRFDACVYLSQLVNWGTFSHGEFLRRAVHLPNHPDHEQAKQLLKQVTANEKVSSNLLFL